MCIICVIPGNKTMLEKELDACAKSNPHGAGLMYATEDGLKFFKTVDNMDAMKRLFYKIRESHPEAPLVLHYRIATHGSVKKDNCHPFFFNTEKGEGFGICHNGVLAGFETEDYTDSYGFGRQILARLGPTFWRNTSTLALIDKYVRDRSSKVVILPEEDGIPRIMGEKLGHWNEGRWFSNYSYTPPLTRPYYSYTRGQGRRCELCDEWLVQKDEISSGICIRCTEWTHTNNGLVEMVLN